MMWKNKNFDTGIIKNYDGVIAITNKRSISADSLISFLIVSIFSIFFMIKFLVYFFLNCLMVCGLKGRHASFSRTGRTLFCSPRTQP